ncbi:MAG: OmpA family protein [Flammeovirgaceae bacterium]
MRRTRVILTFTTILLLGLQTFVFAQKEKDKGKQTKTKKGKKGLLLKKFKPNDSTLILQKPKLSFPNLYKLRYYYNEKELAEIKRLSDEQEWNALYIALFKYVSKFGILNFTKDIDLLWYFARVAEHEERWSAAKEAWRLIIKHHRGDSEISMKHHNPSKNVNWMDVQNYSLQAALTHYDSLTKFEKDLYADLEYYYKLVERRRAIDTLQPPKSVLLNMGEMVNSPSEDYGMTIAGINDNMLFFTSNRVPNALNAVESDLSNRVNEDIFYSIRDEDGIWGQAEPLKAINTAYKEGSPCMNSEGNMIVFARCFSPDGRGNCDLYYSTKVYSEKLQDSVWSIARNLGPNINSKSWDSQPSLSNSGDTLYFSSDRQGGFGGADIYFSVRDKKRGYWGPAKNIGPVINTQRNEVSPHIHPKYNVMYFSSDGHLINFGGFDIFKSYNVAREWLEPKNIGPLVNGKGDELYFAIDSKSEYLFYAKSDEEGNNGLDLHSFPLPMEAQATAVVRFSGKLIEPATGEVFQGIVSVIDLDDGIEVAPKYVREDGSFEFDLIDHKRYLLVIEGDNFFRIEEMFQMEGDGSGEFTPKPIVDDPPPVGTMSSSETAERKTVTFNSIDFDANSAILKPEMENNLHLVIDFLVAHPDYNLRVIGHTDSDGDPVSNMRLSHDRAESIRKYIISYGRLDHNRVKAIGLGDTDPIIKEERTAEDKKLNRRVEFELYKNTEE